jgi:hypothetical protein
MCEDWGEVPDQGEVPDHESFTGWAAEDEFGMPLGITGRHPERFYLMLGRIVSLAAILENKTLGFYQDLVGGTQDDFIELSISALIAKSVAELHRLPGADAEFARQWLSEAKAISSTRNDYVHSLWPAQGDGKLFGCRRRRMKDGTTKIVKLTMDDMKADLTRLVALLESRRLMRFQGLASGRRHLKS